MEASQVKQEGKMGYNRDETFPIDWNDWRKQWDAWGVAHAADLHQTQKRFEGKNFLADEILGTWEINGRTVELSEMTFPNLEDRDERGRLIEGRKRNIGITYAIGAESMEPRNLGLVVRTFAELEAELGI